MLSFLVSISLLVRPQPADMGIMYAKQTVDYLLPHSGNAQVNKKLYIDCDCHIY